LFADNATLIWSGTILSDWIGVGSSYVGFVNYTNYSGLPQYNISAPAMNPVTLLAYDSIKYQWATLNPTGTPLTAYTSLPAVPACPTGVGLQTFNQSSLLPTLGLLALPNSLLQSSSSSATSLQNTPTSGATLSPASHSSLGTSGKIAVAVAVPLVVIALAIGFYLFLCRKKLSQRRAAVNGDQSIPELGANPARSGEWDCFASLNLHVF